MHDNSANCISYRLFTAVAGQEGIFESAGHTINAITPEKLYESTLPLVFKVTSVYATGHKMCYFRIADIATVQPVAN